MGRAKSVSAAGGFSYSMPLVLVSIILFFISFIVIPKYFTPTYSEMFISLVFFISVTYFAGYSLTKDVFSGDDYPELVFMRLGFGLCSLPVLFVLMETFGVPLRWYIVLFLVLARPLYDLLQGLRIRLPSITIKTLRLPIINLHSACAIMIFSIVFTIASYGSYSYPYLEDGDSWEHATGVKYISLFESYTKPEGVYVSHYIRPYPPSYDVLLALIHQLNSSVSWTLKVFNNILVSLSYIFAYYMVRKFTKDNNIALYSTFILFALPPFGSHSIWAHTLSVTVFFPVFYSLDRMRESKTWMILSSIFLAGSLIIQPLMSAVMGVFYLCFIVSRVYANKKEVRDLFIVGAAALLLSMIYWIPVAFDTSQSDLGDVSSDLLAGRTRLGVAAKDSLPTAMQIFFPETHGDIFMQQGYGLFAVLLAILAIDFILRHKPYKLLKNNPWLLTFSLWFAFTLLALLSGAFEFSIYPTRFWGIVAIPMALLGGFMLVNLRKLRWIPRKFAKYAVHAVLIGLLATSAYPKIMVQLAVWPTDLQYVVASDFAGYLLLKDLPANTPVYSFCTKDAYVIGLDKLSFPWDPDIANSRTDPININPKILHSLLKSKDYNWVIFDYNCIKRCTEKSSNTKDYCKSAFARTLQSLEESGLFTMRWRSQSTSIFRVN